jgi:hypothetical protein
MRFLSFEYERTGIIDENSVVRCVTAELWDKNGEATVVLSYERCNSEPVSDMGLESRISSGCTRRRVDCAIMPVYHRTGQVKIHYDYQGQPRTQGGVGRVPGAVKGVGAGVGGDGGLAGIGLGFVGGRSVKFRTPGEEAGDEEHGGTGERPGGGVTGAGGSAILGDRTGCDEQ